MIDIDGLGSRLVDQQRTVLAHAAELKLHITGTFVRKYPVYNTVVLGQDHKSAQFRQEFLHAAGALVDVLLGHRVRDADVFRGSEGLARHRDDMGLVE